jgi:hypothetical protein
MKLTVYFLLYSCCLNITLCWSCMLFMLCWKKRVEPVNELSCTVFLLGVMEQQLYMLLYVVLLAMMGWAFF